MVENASMHTKFKFVKENLNLKRQCSGKVIRNVKQVLLVLKILKKIVNLKLMDNENILKKITF